MTPIDHLARRVFILRRTQRMTQRALAHAVGCSPAIVSKLETGKLYTIKLDYLVAFARVLDTSVDDLLGITGEEARPSRHTDVHW